jgi:hypothetical protein
VKTTSQHGERERPPAHGDDEGREPDQADPQGGENHGEAEVVREHAARHPEPGDHDRRHKRHERETKPEGEARRTLHAPPSRERRRALGLDRALSFRPVPPPIMSCSQLVELVSDYVEDRLPVRERLRFEEHLAVCGPCRSYFDQMRDTIRLTGELREETLDPAVRDAAVEAFRDWKGA